MKFITWIIWKLHDILMSLMEILIIFHRRWHMICTVGIFFLWQYASAFAILGIAWVAINRVASTRWPYGLTSINETTADPFQRRVARLFMKREKEEVREVDMMYEKVVNYNCDTKKTNHVYTIADEESC